MALLQCFSVDTGTVYWSNDALKPFENSLNPCTEKHRESQHQEFLTMTAAMEVTLTKKPAGRSLPALTTTVPVELLQGVSATVNTALEWLDAQFKWEVT